ncbi:MAG: glutathione synthase [Gammaproteobacteria bacterium]|nr:glutathione synthase [Gammaproteobacteria bacterium]
MTDQHNPIKLGVIMDPIASIDFHHDSTLALLLNASKRHWQLHYMEQADLFWHENRAYAESKQLNVYDDNNHWYDFAATATLPLEELDIILMRKDPPFNMNYIMTTYFLDHAAKAGTLVVNSPQALRDANEKFFTTHFAHCMPPTLISSRLDLLQRFHHQHGKVIFKPLDLMGGQGIFLAEPEQDSRATVEKLSHQGQIPIMAQRYLPEISAGDKRILMIDGEPIPYALARIPQPGSFLGNIAAGGCGEPRQLSERDRWICEQVGPTLKQKGLLFVGLDIIGDYLTEINVTCPTCITEFRELFQVDTAEKLLDTLEKKLSLRKF